MLRLTPVLRSALLQHYFNVMVRNFVLTLRQPYISPTSALRTAALFSYPWARGLDPPRTVPPVGPTYFSLTSTTLQP